MSLVPELSALSPDEFAWAALTLLKLEVSPNVRLVSIQGPDGGRDAVLDGACITARYEWNGYWVFQFKHYRNDDASARSRVLTDYRAGVERVISVSPRRMDNYILVTSVRLTGTPSVGLFDRVEKLKSTLALEFGLRLDLWDGLEIQALLLKHRELASRLNENNIGTRRRDTAPGYTTPAAALLLASSAERDLSTTQIALMLRDLIGDLPNPLSPGSTSWLWSSYMRSDNLSGRALISNITKSVARRARAVPELGRSLVWLRLTLGAIEARLGSPRLAAQLAARVLGTSSEPSAVAWALNIQSVAEGKLDRLTRYRAVSRRALVAAQESDDSWLWATIRLRMLHKVSWALGEAGMPMDNATFHDELSTIMTGVNCPEIEAQDHLSAQVDAYTGLQLTWHRDEWASAERAINSADSRFRDLGDFSESARVTSERGRLFLLSGADATRTVSALVAAARQRLRQGELPRLRYDLLWLGEAYARLSAGLEAETCWCLGRSIHEQLYGSSRVDSGIVRALDFALAEASGEIAGQMRARRLTYDYCAGLVAASLEIEEAELSYLADIERFRSFASSRFE